MTPITIIHENRTGLIAAVSELLEKAGINIDDINARVVGSSAEIRLITSHYGRALELLNAAGFKAVPQENILIRVDDRPGALARVARKLSQAGIDIRGMTMVEQHDGYNLVTLTTDDDAQARSLLQPILVA